MPADKFMKQRLKFSELIIHIVVAAMIFFSFYQGQQAANKVDWIFDKDMVRNISMAQSMLDGHPLSDSIFYGETLWYNPMLPALTATVSKITGSPLIAVNMRIGAYLNLLVPVGFYLLLLFAFNIRTAAVATIGMLFIFNNSIPTYMSGTYSAVSYALHLAPGFFFLSLLFYIKGRKSGKALWHILCGCMLGFAFLAHSTPALIMGAVISVDFLILLLKRPVIKIIKPDGRQIIFNFLIVVFTSMLISSPLLYSIMFKYHLKVINHAPARVIESILRSYNFNLFIGLITPRTAILLIMLAGLIFIIIKRKEIAPRLILISTLVVLALISLSYFAQIAPKALQLPQIVPGLHYIQYFGFLEAIFFGVGAGLLIDYLAKSLATFIRRIKPSVKPDGGRQPFIQTAIVLIAVFLLFSLYEAEYLDRWDFNKFKMMSTKRNKELLAVNEWLISNIEPEAIMLNDEGLPAGIMMAARKMITNPAGDAASNSFVDYMARWKDRNDMFAALENKDYSTLQKLFKKYNAKYVFEAAGSNSKYWGSPLFLKKIYEQKQLAVYKVDYSLLDKVVAQQQTFLSGYPYATLGAANIFMSVSVFQLEPWNFNYLETTALQSVMKNCRWLNAGRKKLNLLNALATVKCNSAMIVKRKELMELASSGALENITRNDIMFCNFSPPREVIKIDRVFPEKIIVFCGQSEFLEKLRGSNAHIFRLEDLTKLHEKNFVDNDTYIKTAVLLVFNSGIYKKYVRDMKIGLEQNRITRKQILESFLRQAAEINY
jgi:hypothetical protein